MKLLLTSAGITNNSIKAAFLQMIGKAPEETSIAFIPTASDVEPGDKDWVLDDIARLRACASWKQFDIVDIAAMDKRFWEKRIREADVIYVEGGNEFFLMYHIEKSGLMDMLPELLEKRVWVGSSAGSMVLGKRIDPELSKYIYEEEIAPPFDHVEKFLDYVDFAIKPHLDSPIFSKANEANLAKHASTVAHTFYALDDRSAIRVIDGIVDVVSEGKWKKYN
jgi:dipeptidase E